MPEEALPIPPSISVEAGKLPHQEQISAQKWGHTFTKIAYASVAVAAVAFTVALVAAAVLFSGGAAALPILIAFGAVFALTGGGAAVAKFFQEKMAQKDTNLTAQQGITSRLYESLGKDTTVEDIQVASRIQDKAKLSEYLDLVNKRNRRENISDGEIQNALNSIPLPEGNAGEKQRLLLNKIAVPRPPVNELPYANLIPRMQALFGDKYDAKIARKLLYSFKDPIDQVRIANVLNALEKTEGKSTLDIRSVGDALLDSTGGSRQLDDILYRLVITKTDLDFKPLIDSLKNSNVSLFERDIVYEHAFKALNSNPQQLTALKQEFERGVQNNKKNELFNAILNFKVSAEWSNYIINLQNSEDNLALKTSEFLQNIRSYPTNENLLIHLADLIGDKTPPFLTIEEIQNNLSSLKEGPLFLAVKDGSGQYAIKEFAVQKVYRPFDTLKDEYYAIKAETPNRRLVEAIKLIHPPRPMHIPYLSPSSAAKAMGDPKSEFDIDSIELAYYSRVNELDGEKDLSKELKHELSKHNFSEDEAKFFLNNFKTREEQNNLIRMLEFVRATKNVKGTERVVYLIQATTPFFNLLCKSRDFERNVTALKMINKLLTPPGELVPYRYKEVLAAIPILGLKPGDQIPLIKAGDLGEPKLIEQVYQGDKEPRFLKGENDVSPSGAQVNEYYFTDAEPFKKEEVWNGKSDLVNRYSRTMINKEFDDPTLKVLGSTYHVMNRKGEIVQIRVQQQFEKELTRFTTITINGKTYKSPMDIAQALYTACDDDPERMLNLSPFLSQAAIASGAAMLNKIKEGDVLPKQKTISLSISSSEEAIDVTIDTVYAITENPDRVVLSEFATSKTMTLFKDELKAAAAEKSSGSEKLFKLSKSNRIKDNELVLSKIKNDEVDGFKESLGELDIYSLEWMNPGKDNFKKLNDILQPLYRRLVQSKMSRSDKLAVLAAIHRLSSRDARTVPMPYEEAIKYNKDLSQMYFLEVSNDRALALKKGMGNVLKQSESTNPILTQEIIRAAETEFEKPNSTFEINVGLEPIEINNYLQSVEFQTKVDYKIGEGDASQTIQVNPVFVKDVSRYLYMINGQMLYGEAATAKLNAAVNDPAVMRYLAMILNQGSMALPSTFTAEKFAELVGKQQLGNPIVSDPLFIVEVEGDVIKVRGVQESLYVDKESNPVKNAIIMVEFIFTKEMFHTQDFSKASYVVRQINKPLDDYKFLGENHANEIPILKSNLYPLSIALLRDYLEYKKSIGNNPSDEQLAVLLEKYTDLMMSLSDNKNPQLLKSLDRITAFPKEILLRMPSILKYYKKDMIRIIDVDHLNVMSLAKYKVNKETPDQPIRFLNSISQDPEADWMKDTFNIQEEVPSATINSLLVMPKHLSKTLIELENGQKIAYPEISRTYLEKAKFMIKNKEADGKSAANAIHNLVGGDIKKTEMLMHLATEENEKAMLFKAQQWINVNYGTQYKVSNPQVLHRIDMVEGKPAYTMEIQVEVNIDGKMVTLNMMRIISIDEEDFNKGSIEKSFIQDKITVVK